MELRFFRPEFFSALIILGVLLLIHLLKRPKTIVLKFSTLQFFNTEAPKKTKAHKLRRLLLLFARLSLSTLLIFLFADPYIEKSVLSSLLNPNVSVFVWIDHSLSMDYFDGNPTIGQEATTLVDSLMKELPVTGKKFIYDDNIDEFINYQYEKGIFKSRHGPLNLESVLNKIQRHKNYSPHSVILLISDYQASTTNEIDSVMSQISIETNTVFVDMSPDSPWNFSIESASFNSGTAVEVEVKGSGRALLSGKVGITRKNVHSVPVNVSFEKDSSVKIIVPFADRTEGIYNIQLYEDDPLKFDNIQSFSVDKKDGGAVAILGDVKDNYVIAKAFEALRGSYWKTIFLRDCGTISDKEINQASIIIINNSGKPCPVIEKIVSSSLFVNKSIFYCMGIDTVLFAYNDLNILKSVIPSLSAIKTKSVKNFVYPILPDTISGLWYGFKGKYEKMVRIKSYVQSIPGFPLCYLSDGGVLFSTLIDKKGIRWIFSSTPLGKNFSNNFWESGVYVPMLDRLGRFARSRALSGVSIVAGYPVSNPIFKKGKGGYIYDSEGKLYPVVSKPHIVFKKPGIYKIFEQGKFVQHILVTSDTAESRMNYRVPEINNLSSDNKIVCTPDDLLKILHRKSGDLYYFVPWLILALLILIEILLCGKKLPLYKKQKSVLLDSGKV